MQSRADRSPPVRITLIPRYRSGRPRPYLENRLNACGVDLDEELPAVLLGLDVAVAKGALERDELAFLDLAGDG